MQDLQSDKKSIDGKDCRSICLGRETHMSLASQEWLLKMSYLSKNLKQWVLEDKSLFAGKTNNVLSIKS